MNRDRRISHEATKARSYQMFLRVFVSSWRPAAVLIQRGRATSAFGDDRSVEPLPRRHEDRKPRRQPRPRRSPTIVRKMRASVLELSGQFARFLAIVLIGVAENCFTAGRTPTRCPDRGRRREAVPRREAGARR